MTTIRSYLQLSCIASRAALRRADFGQQVRRLSCQLTGAFLCVAISVSCSTPHTNQPWWGTKATHHTQVDLLLGVFNNSEFEADRRQRAAEQLIALGDQLVIKVFVAQLTHDGDPTTKQLILRALASADRSPPTAFQPHLMRLLSQAQEPHLNDLAAALGRYLNAKLTRKLARIALNARFSVSHRYGAALTLGYDHSPIAARALMALLESDQPTAVQDAAYQALARSACVNPDEHDYGYWQHWWAKRRDLSDRLWYETLVGELVRRNTSLMGQSHQVTERLTDVQRQLYRTMPQDDRPAFLVTMLSDPFDAIRQLAIDLCVQRLIDTQEIEPDVRNALRKRLDDPNAGIRQHAVLLLRDLGDDEAADTVAQRLVSGQERHPRVRRACLAMLAQRPRAAVIDHALGWLDDSWLGPESAGVLAAATDLGLLDPFQSSQAAIRVREQLYKDQIPEPKFIQLLGRVGDDRDWDRIAAWINSDHDAVKQSAAQAWAQSNQPLRVLLQHAADPVLQQIVIAAARQRGFLPETLHTLIDHKPDQDQVVQTWQFAVVAVAGRVPATVALQAENRLAQKGSTPELREQVLSAAINRLLPDYRLDGGDRPRQGDVKDQMQQQEHPSLIDLLLTRAGVYLSSGDPPRALADYGRLESAVGSMAPSQLRMYQLGVLRARIAAGHLESAFDWATQMGLSAPATDEDAAMADQIVTALLEAAGRTVSLNHAPPEQKEMVRRVLSQLHQLWGSAVSAGVRQQLKQLEQELVDVSEKSTSPPSESDEHSNVNGATSKPHAAQTAPTPPQ